MAHQTDTLGIAPLPPAKGVDGWHDHLSARRPPWRLVKWGDLNMEFFSRIPIGFCNMVCNMCWISRYAEKGKLDRRYSQSDSEAAWGTFIPKTMFLREGSGRCLKLPLVQVPDGNGWFFLLNKNRVLLIALSPVNRMFLYTTWNICKIMLEGPRFNIFEHVVFVSYRIAIRCQPPKRAMSSKAIGLDRRPSCRAKLWSKDVHSQEMVCYPVFKLLLIGSYRPFDRPIV